MRIFTEEELYKLIMDYPDGCESGKQAFIEHIGITSAYSVSKIGKGVWISYDQLDPIFETDIPDLNSHNPGFRFELIEQDYKNGENGSNEIRVSASEQAWNTLETYDGLEYRFVTKRCIVVVR